MPPQNRRSDHVPRFTSLDSTLSASARELLEAYRDLLVSWAPRLDLISEKDVPHIWSRHILDSLKGTSLIASLEAGPGVDVGSGAGLPGVPLAVADPSRHWRLLEPRKRRAAFLEEVIRELNLEIEVLSISAQEASRRADLRDHTVAVARALAPPQEAADLLLPLLGEGGTAVLWVGKDAKLPANAALSSEGLATISKE